VARTADGGEGGGGQQMVASLNRGQWLKLCEGLKHLLGLDLGLVNQLV